MEIIDSIGFVERNVLASVPVTPSRRERSHGARERRVTSDGRNRQRVEDRDVPGRLGEGDIRVPTLATEQSRPARFLAHFENLGHPVGADDAIVVVMYVRFTEVGREVAELARARRRHVVDVIAAGQLSDRSWTRPDRS
jgi:hypothetical protein